MKKRKIKLPCFDDVKIGPDSLKRALQQPQKYKLDLELPLLTCDVIGHNGLLPVYIVRRCLIPVEILRNST
jgi:hypothetical protein